MGSLESGQNKLKTYGAGSFGPGIRRGTMLDIIRNPVVISVILMCVLCLLKLNVLLVLIISSMAGGIAAGMPIDQTMTIFMNGMAGNSETALSYILLGAIAVGIAKTGLMSILSDGMQRVFEGKKLLFIAVIAGISSLSGTIIPVNIAFMPILIPPLIYMMNRMKIDRRAVACALCWGNRAPYLFLPVGYGLIFHHLIAGNMTKYGMPMETMEIWKAMIFPAGIGMLLGLLFAVLVLYRKPREYKEIIIAGADAGNKAEGKNVLNRRHIGAILAALSTFIIQLIFNSLVIGGLVGLLIMVVTGCFKYSELDETINSGIAMIGWISFIMLAASGFSEVIVATHGIENLVAVSANVLSASKFIASAVLILIGFTIVMGTGTCFGTVPILSAIYVPMCMTLGYTALGTASLIGVAAAVGDVCSPASDGTLGPTSGLNPDGQHDHIWDSTVPAVLVFSLPLFVIGVVTSAVL